MEGTRTHVLAVNPQKTLPRLASRMQERVHFCALFLQMGNKGNLRKAERTFFII